MTKVQIVSTPALKIADSERVIAWARRSTEKTPVAVEQRYRAVTIKADSLKIPLDTCSSKFYTLLQSTVHDLADVRFQAWVKDNMNEIEMESDILSLDSVLAFWAAEKQRMVVDGEQIKLWLLKSETYENLSESQKLVWARTLQIGRAHV